MERQHVYAPPGVLHRVRLLDLLRDSGHLSLRLLRRNAGLEPRKDTQVAAGGSAVVDRRIERDRHPCFHLVIEKVKTGRHHSHDGALPATHGRLLANHSRITAEACLPKLITEDDDEVVTGAILFRKEEAPGEWLHA